MGVYLRVTEARPAERTAGRYFDRLLRWRAHRDAVSYRAHSIGEEVVALIVDDHEGGEVPHLDAPDRFHT